MDTLKKKLEEMGDMKRQLKVLEEKNLSYMQNNFQLEEVQSYHFSFLKSSQTEFSFLMQMPPAKLMSSCNYPKPN